MPRLVGGNGDVNEDLKCEEELCAFRQGVVWPAFDSRSVNCGPFLHAESFLLQTAARSKVEIIDTFKHNCCCMTFTRHLDCY